MLVYYTRTNNTKRMLKKLGMDIPSIDITNYDGKGKYILITPTYGFGEIPDEVNDFLTNHHENMIAVISSGNKNWGMKFAKSGKLISEKYNVPLLYQYELSGMKDEIEQLRKVLNDFYGLH